MTHCGRFAILLGALVALLLVPAASFAAGLDSPMLEPVARGHGKIVLRVTAGPSGAPHGFTVYWMTQQDFDGSGGQWPAAPSHPRLSWADYDGVPTLNTDGGRYSSFQLAPSQSIEIEVGDLADETGVTTNAPVELAYTPTCGVPYVFTAFANGSAADDASGFAPAAAAATTDVQNCTFTQGYWKTHPGAWPVANLTLGTVSYTAAQLQQILDEPVGGNGLISLAHQLIAAKLNIANGASAAAVATAIPLADALIGALVVPPIGGGLLAPPSTSALTQTLDNFNNGITGPGHCADTPGRSTTWGKLKSIYR